MKLKCMPSLASGSFNCIFDLLHSQRIDEGIDDGFENNQRIT